MALDLWQILVHTLGFFLLVALLKRLAWGPLLGLLDQRRRQIAQGLEDVEQAKQELARLKGQYEQELVRIEESARRKLAEAVQEGRRVAAEMEEEGRVRAQESLIKATEALGLEVAKARAALRDQIVAMTVEATEKLLRARLDEGRDRALVETFIAELDGGGAATPAPAKGQR